MLGVSAVVGAGMMWPFRDLPWFSWLFTVEMIGIAVLLVIPALLDGVRTGLRSRARRVALSDWRRRLSGEATAPARAQAARPEALAMVRGASPGEAAIAGGDARLRDMNAAMRSWLAAAADETVLDVARVQGDWVATGEALYLAAPLVSLLLHFPWAELAEVSVGDQVASRRYVRVVTRDGRSAHLSVDATSAADLEAIARDCVRS